jgi:hypothetical protein
MSLLAIEAYFKVGGKLRFEGSGEILCLRFDTQATSEAL